jgi:enoyl-CoA hydratase/carnithine racemase
MTHAKRQDVDGVITVTFTRPEKRNAVDHEMFDAIRYAVRDLRDQDHLRVLMLTAEGEYYTGGKDVADLATRVGETRPAGGTEVRGSNIRAGYRAEAYHDLFDAIEQVEKPVILAAQGHCLGVGVEMGSSCDFRFAAEGAVFGLPEVENLAVLPGSGGISRLTRIVGPHWARWLAMACERVDARQALAIGLLHAVYPVNEFAERVQAFARKLAGMPREALGVAKVAIDTADTVDRATARVFDRFSQTLLFTSDEFKDRVNSFNQASEAREAQRQSTGGQSAS